jgi:hypothetical protein
MGNEDTLISKLIEETCSEASESEGQNSFTDLRKYFEKRLNEVDFNSISDYLDQNQLSHQVLSFENKSRCYRLKFKQSVLDFPSNWSIFSEIETNDLIYVDQSVDEDYLLDIFSEICGSFQNVVLLKENTEVQLVFLPGENAIEHVSWMRNYFEKKSGSENTAA